MEIKKVGIAGAGALGVLVGKKLNDFLGKDNVVFIADEERCRRYREEGIYSNGELCDFSYVDKPQEGTLDLIIIALKDYVLQETLPLLKPFVGEDTILMSLMNGITSEEIIGEALGKDKVIYTVSQGMDASKVGNQHSFHKAGLYWIGEADGSESQRLNDLGALFDQAGIVYEIHSDIIYRTWSKLMLNTGINQTMSVLEKPYKWFHENIDEARTTTRAAMEEVRSVAAEEGVVIAESDIDEWFRILDGLGADKKPSMLHDVEAGRATEVELFAGTIRRLGEKHGIPTPVNDWLYEELQKKSQKGRSAR